MDAILEIFILSGVSYLIYAICMGRNVSYAVRRRYLLISISASGIIPFVEIPVEVSVAQEIYQVLHYNSAGTENYSNIYGWIYCAGLLFMGGVFFRQLSAIRKKINEGVISRYNYKGAHVLECARSKGDEFSFFGKISISDSLPSNEKALILEHELSHVRHNHSLEKVFMGFLKVVMWFNPFVYIAAIHVEELQEYEADYDVLASGADKKEYVALIVEQVITSALPVGSKFYSYFTKSRFNWMLNPPRNRKGVAVVPFTICVAVMVLSALQANCIIPHTEITIPHVGTDADSLEHAGKMHLYTPDNKKFNTNKIQSVPEPDEQVLMIVN